MRGDTEPSPVSSTAILKQSGQLVQIFPLEVHRRMNIAVQGNIYISVSKDFAQCFDVHALLNASRGKGVTKRVECCVMNIARFQNVSKATTQVTRLHIFYRTSG